MSAIKEYDRKTTLTRVFDGLTDPRHRAVLAALGEGPTPVSERELAADFAGEAVGETAWGDRESVRATLRHVLLPKLASLSLVDWDPEAGTVAPSDHPVHDDPGFAALLRADADRWAVAATVNGDDRRRATVEAHAAGSGPTSREELARAVRTDGDTDDVEEVAVELHHVHLPKLDDAGVLEYDADAGVVEGTGEVNAPLVEPAVRAN